MAIPSLLYTMLVFSIPESPRWLIARKNDVTGAKKVLERLRADDVDGIVASIKKSLEHETSKQSGFF